MSTKTSIDADEPVTCGGALSSIYPNTGGMTGTVGGVLTATDSFDSSDHLCAVRNQKSGWVDYGSGNDKCISEPACCTSGFTITFWMRNRTPVGLGYISIILSTGGQASKARGLLLYTVDYFALDVRGFLSSTSVFKLLVNGYYPGDQWTHHSFTFEKAVGTKYYKNGTFVDSTNVTLNEGPGTSHFDNVVMFSRNNNPSTWPFAKIDGDFSNFKMFYKYFSDTEVQNAYLQETSESKLLIHYLRKHSHEGSFGIELECLAKAGSPPAVAWHRSDDGTYFESVSPSVDVAIYEGLPNSYRRRSVLVVRHLTLACNVVFVCEAIDTVRGGHVSKTITIPKRVMFWTPWLSADSPSDGDDRETLIQHQQAYDLPCKYPSDIQCRTVYDGISSNETGQILNINCTLSSGLECLGADQGAEHDNSCFDYKVRYQCPGPHYRWTPWYNASDPDGTMEDETLATHMTQAYPYLCSQPIGAECRLKATQQDLIASGYIPEVPYLCNANGFRCQHADNTGSCPDFEVRYRCPETEAIDIGIDYLRSLHSPSDTIVRLQCSATPGQPTPHGFNLEWAWLDRTRPSAAVTFTEGPTVDILVNASHPNHWSSVLTIVDFAYTEYSSKTLVCLARDGIVLAVETVQPLFERPEPTLLEFWKLSGEPSLNYPDPSSCSSVSENTFPSSIGDHKSRVIGHMTYIDAPAVVDHACAVLSDTDSALDLGSFDGECVSSPDLCSRGLTFALWVMAFDPVQMTSDWFFLSSGGHSSSAHGIAFYQSASDRSFRFKLRTSTKYVGEAVLPNNKISKEMWFHLALVFDHNDGIKVYVNGNLSAESRDFQNEVKNDGEVNLVVGAASDSSGFSKAAFSDLRVYAGAMTPSQVMDVMTCNSLNVSFEITEVRQLQPPLDSALSFECRARGIPNPILEWELKGGNGESTVPSSSPQSVEQTSINVTECLTRSTLRVHSNSENFTIAVCRATSSGQELVKDLKVVMHRAETITTSAVTAAVTNQQSHQTTTKQPGGDVVTVKPTQTTTKQPGGDVVTVKPTQNGKTGTRGVTKSTDTTEASRNEGAARTWPSSSSADRITQTPSGSRVTPDPTPETIGEGEATIVTMDAADTMRTDSGDTSREPDDHETLEPSVTMSSPNDFDGDDDLEETPGQKSKSKLTWLAPVGVCIVLLGIPAAFVLHYICKKKNNSVHALAALLSTKQVTVPRPKSIKRYRGATPMAPPKATPIHTPTQQAIRMVDVHEVNDPFDLTESMEKNM